MGSQKRWEHRTQFLVHFHSFISYYFAYLILNYNHLYLVLLVFIFNTLNFNLKLSSHSLPNISWIIFILLCCFIFILYVVPSFPLPSLYFTFYLSSYLPALSTVTDFHSFYTSATGLILTFPIISVLILY